jgi:dihydroxyacetone kinase-like predicted kinase
MKPVEGTILTVIREISEAADQIDSTIDIKEF